MRLSWKNALEVSVVYGALALLVVLPLFRPGYLFAMDMTIGRVIRWPEPFGFYFYGMLVYGLNAVFSPPVIQKMLLFLILFLSGVGAHRLVSGSDRWPKYFAGVLYVFNPFVYSRFLFGQMTVLLAYAFMPFVLRSMLDFFRERTLRRALDVSFWCALVGAISAHFLVLTALLFVVGGTVTLIASWKKRSVVLRVGAYTVLISLCVLLLSSWWVAPYFDQTSSAGQFVQETVTAQDRAAFRTDTDARYGVLANVAALYGFWGDRHRQYTLAKDVLPYWPALFLFIFALVVLGAGRTLWRRPTTEDETYERRDALVLVIAACIAFVFSVGIAYKPFAPRIEFLNEKFFILRGFRDSQKFTAVLLLAYAYCGALGVRCVLQYIERARWRTVVALKLAAALSALFIVLPILYTPLMVWGFRGQLAPAQYPQSWYAANDLLNNDPNRGRILFFPWHHYMSFRFTNNRVVVNPALNFFDRDVVIADNIEIGSIYSQSAHPLSRLIEQEILAKRDEVTTAGSALAAQGISYVLLAKEVDWQQYSFLDRQRDLRVVYDTDDLRVYEVILPVDTPLTERSASPIL